MLIRFLVNTTVNGVSYVPGQEQPLSPQDSEMVISLGGGVEVVDAGSSSSEPEPTKDMAKDTPKLWNTKRKK